MPFGQPASKRIDLDSVTSVVRLAQGGRCIVTAIRAANTVAATSYVQVFDVVSTSSVILGTTVPKWVIRSAASDSSDGDGFPSTGLLFDNGIAVASTTTATGSTSATQHVYITVI